EVTDLQREVKLPVVFQLRTLSLLQGIDHQSPCVLRRQWLFRQRLDDTSDPQHRWRPHCQMKIRSSPLGRNHQNIDQVMFLHIGSNGAQDSRELVCKKVHTVLLVCGREKIQITLHRVRNLLRMHGRNNEMSGFRSLQRRQRSLVIPDLTNKNDIWRLTKRTPQPDRKSAGVAPHLSLGEMTALAGELILDGILDRHYMSHEVLVHPLKEGRDGGGFP